MEAVTSGPKYNSDTTSAPPTNSNQATSSITNVLAPAEGWEHTSSRFLNALEKVSENVLSSNANQIDERQSNSMLTGAANTSVRAGQSAVSGGEQTSYLLGQTVTAAPSVEHQTASHSTATEQYYKEALGATVMSDGGAGVLRSTVGWSNKQQQRPEQRIEQRTEQTRKVSSTVIESTDLESPPENKITYIDVPVYEEEVTYVPRRETREVIKTKKVPRYIEKEEVRVRKPAPIQRIVYDVVEEIQYVEKPVEKIVKVPVPVTKYNIKYKDIPVPRQVVERETYDVESIHYRDVPVDAIVHEDEEVPVIISQQIKPVFVESPNSHLDVNVVQYEPEVIPIDIHVAKPVTSMLRSGDIVENSHKLVTINSAQYNSILKRLNAHLEPAQQSQLPYISEFNVVKFVPDADSQYIIAPSGIEIEGYNLKKPIGSSSANVETFSSKPNYANSSMVVPQIRVTNNDSMAQNSAAQVQGGQSLNTTNYSTSRPTNLGGGDVFEGYREVRQSGETVPSASSSSATESAGNNRMIRSARVCCNVNPTDVSSHTTSATSSRPFASSQQQMKSAAEQFEGVKEYATKVGQRIAQENTNSSMEYSAPNQNRHLGDGQGVTYPSANRQVLGSRQSVSGSASLRVDTVQSYRSQLEQNAARRSRVCC